MTATQAFCARVGVKETQSPVAKSRTLAVRVHGSR
jgi:hypothetical protein